MTGLVTPYSDYTRTISTLLECRVDTRWNRFWFDAGTPKRAAAIANLLLKEGAIDNAWAGSLKKNETSDPTDPAGRFVIMFGYAWSKTEFDQFQDKLKELLPQIKEIVSGKKDAELPEPAKPVPLPPIDAPLPYRDAEKLTYADMAKELSELLGLSVATDGRTYFWFKTADQDTNKANEKAQYLAKALEKWSHSAGCEVFFSWTGEVKDKNHVPSRLEPSGPDVIMYAPFLEEYGPEEFKKIKNMLRKNLDEFKIILSEGKPLSSAAETSRHSGFDTFMKEAAEKKARNQAIAQRLSDIFTVPVQPPKTTFLDSFADFSLTLPNKSSAERLFKALDYIKQNNREVFCGRPFSDWGALKSVKAEEKIYHDIKHPLVNKVITIRTDIMEKDSDANKILALLEDHRDLLHSAISGKDFPAEVAQHRVLYKGASEVMR